MSPSTDSLQLIFQYSHNSEYYLSKSLKILQSFEIGEVLDSQLLFIKQFLKNYQLILKNNYKRKFSHETHLKLLKFVPQSLNGIRDSTCAIYTHCYCPN